MEGWKTVKLDQLCELNIGKTPARDNPNFWDKDKKCKHIWLSIADMARTKNRFVTDSKEYISAKGAALFKPVLSGTLLMSFKLTIGRLVYAANTMYTNEAIVALPIKNEKAILKEYLYYYLSSIDWNGLTKNDMKVKGKTLNKKKLKQLDILVPALPVQKAIVAKLDAAFASIDIAIAAAERNAENAKQLFQSYLSDVFERGGDGWVEQTLGGVCKFIGGSQPPKSSFEKAVAADNIRLIQIRDYKSDKHITYIKRSAARRFCTAEDIMIGRYGPPIFQILRGLEGAYNVALMKAEPNQKFLSRDYLFYFLQHPAIQNHVINASTRAAGQSGMNKETIAPYPIRLPSMSEQASIVTAVLSMSEQSKSLVRKYNKKYELLNQLKQSLLQQAFTGQLVDA